MVKAHIMVVLTHTIGIYGSGEKVVRVLEIVVVNIYQDTHYYN